MESVRTVVGKAAEATNNVISHEPETPENAEERKNREAIVQGLLMGRVVWSGSFVPDLWFYLKQTHVFLSILMAHKMHPFSRGERGFTFVASLLASFGFSMLFLDKTGEKADGNVAMAAGILASILQTIMYTVTVLAMTCSCVQEGSCIFSCAGNYGRSTVESIGRCVGCFNFVLSAIIFAVGLLRGMSDELPINLGVQAWAYAQVSSLVLGFATGFCMFVFAYYGLRCCCCCACCCPGQAGPNGSKSSSAYPHGPEYPTDMNLLQGGDCCSCVGSSSLDDRA